MTRETIAHYRIVEDLGRSGRVASFRAVDARLDRDVVLKVFEADGEAALAACEGSARAAAAVSHRALRTVHDVFVDAGRLVMVVEVCRGPTLREILGEGPLALPRAIDVATQVAEALATIHAHGLVHGALDPDRVFVSDDAQVKVADLGLAEPGPEGALVPLTPSGTPPAVVVEPAAGAGYRAPEQFAGHAADARSDLFALGAMLYEMLTGVRAFPGAQPAAVADAVLRRGVVPVRQLDPSVPMVLAAAVERLLEKDPAARYPDAAALAADLDRADQRLVVRAAERTRRRPLARPWWRRRGTIAVAVALVAVVAAGTWAWRARRPEVRPLTHRDAILFAAFDNRTGQPVFDDTVSQALQVQLAQSPFLNIVADERVRETLRQMERSPNERLTGTVALEVCQRLGLQAMVRGSIARLGSAYAIVVDAVNCETGSVIAGEQAQASGQDDVLPTIGRVASALRARLGESLQSIERFDVPVAQATTPSLAALKAYTLGLAQRDRGAELESVPFFEHALELDPGFAAAATMLSTVYGNLGEPARSEEFARRAFEHSAEVSERERLFITYQYHDRVTGDQEEVAATLERWTRTFPNDFRPANALAVLHSRYGAFDRAVAEAEEALRRSPEHPFPLSNLAHALRGLGRYSEAKRVADDAVALGVETVPTRRLLYQLAVLAGDTGAAAYQVAWARGRPREFDLVAAQAQVAAYHGRMREAGRLYRDVAELAQRRNLPEVAGAYLAHEALARAVYGDLDRAASLARESVAAPDREASAAPRVRAVTALALAGDADGVRRAKAALAERPRATFTSGVLVPSTRAAHALAAGRASEAVAVLDAARPFETGTVAALVPLYLRGQAYLALRDGARARAEFAAILAHRGSEPFSPVCALAHLGIARAERLLGNPRESARAYDEFFAIWAEADPDVPVLQAARAERKTVSFIAPS
jgi:Tfp pilus assembly protein PilF